MMDKQKLTDFLERAYTRYNHRGFVHPDPLEFLYMYDDPLDREVVAMVASSLAYGRVAQILKSVAKVLSILDGHPKLPVKFEHKGGGKWSRCKSLSQFERRRTSGTLSIKLVKTTKQMGRLQCPTAEFSPVIWGHPAQALLELDCGEIRQRLGDFKHRFTTGTEMAAFLTGLKKILHEYGSLHALIRATPHGPWPNRVDAFARRINEAAGGLSSLVPLPSRGSACKRLMMFFRWMVRKDEVDVGDWHELGAYNLIVPLDTHMFRVARMLKFTNRATTGMKTAIEITNRFKELQPDDPVKYDFALTRPGIRNEPMFVELLQWDTRTNG